MSLTTSESAAEGEQLVKQIDFRHRRCGMYCDKRDLGVSAIDQTANDFRHGRADITG